MAKDEAKALLTQLLKELQNMGTAVDNAMEDQQIDTRKSVVAVASGCRGCQMYTSVSRSAERREERGN